MATFEITKLSTTGHVKVRNVDTNKYYYYAGNRTTAKIVNNTVVIDPENDDTHVSINVVDSVDTIVYSGTSSPFTGTADNPVDHCDFLNTYCFFEPGGNALTSVAFAAPLVGNGTIGNPGTLQNGTNVGDILIWNGTNWQIQPNPSWNLEARRNVKTFTFVGGFGTAPLPTTLLVGTPLYRNSTTIVTMLTPGIEGRDPVVQILNDAGNWIKLRTPQIAGSYFVISDVTPKKYYYRQKIKVSSGGNSRHGFIDAPANTVLNGFGFETTGGNIKAFCNTGASYTYGASFAISSGTWYDCEIEYQYIGGSMVCKLFVDGILRSTANRVAGAFSFNASIQSMNTAGATSLIIHTDLIEYSIYG